MVVAAVFIASLTGPKKLSARDDTLHPQEIRSIFHLPQRDELLRQPLQMKIRYG